MRVLPILSVGLLVALGAGATPALGDTTCDVAASGDPVALRANAAVPVGTRIVLLARNGRTVQRIALPPDPAAPVGSTTSLPAVSARGASGRATVAWSTGAETGPVRRVQAAVMNSSGVLTPMVTVSTTGDADGAFGATGAIVAAGSWIAWDDATGPRAALIADDGTAGPVIELPAAGRHPLAAAADATGAGWVLLQAASPGSGVTLVRLAPGAPPQAVDLSALTTFKGFPRLALAADGTGGAFVAAYPSYSGAARLPIRVLHVNAAGVATRAATIMAATDEVALDATGGRALLAYATRVHGHTDVAVRTISSSGRAGAAHRITTTPGRDEFPGDISLQIPSRPLVALRATFDVRLSGTTETAGHVYLVSMRSWSRPGPLTQVSSTRNRYVVDPRVIRADRGVFTTWSGTPIPADENEWTLLARGAGTPSDPLSQPLHRLATGSCFTDEG